MGNWYQGASSSADTQAESERVALQRHARGLPVPLRDRTPGLLVVGRDDAQPAVLPVGLQVDARDEALAGQHRQAVVAVDPLRRGLEDLRAGPRSRRGATRPRSHRSGSKGESSTPRSARGRALSSRAASSRSAAGSIRAAGISLRVEGAGQHRALLPQPQERRRELVRPVPEPPRGGQASGRRPSVTVQGREEQRSSPSAVEIGRLRSGSGSRAR